MKPINLDHILRPFAGKWVAMTQERDAVLASGESPEQVLLLARRKYSNAPILALVPNLDLDFVG